MGKSKLPPIVHSWRRDAKRRRARETQATGKMGDTGPVGIDFQWPPGWDKTGKLRTLKGGIHSGRVIWTSRHEAKEIAKMKSDLIGRTVEYDP